VDIDLGGKGNGEDTCLKKRYPLKENVLALCRVVRGLSLEVGDGILTVSRKLRISGGGLGVRGEIRGPRRDLGEKKKTYTKT